MSESVANVTALTTPFDGCSLYLTQVFPEIKYLLWMGKYNSRTDLMSDWFGFDQTSKVNAT